MMNNTKSGNLPVVRFSAMSSKMENMFDLFLSIYLAGGGGIGNGTISLYIIIHR